MQKRWSSLDPAGQAARPARDGPDVALPPPASGVGRGDGQPEADRCRRRTKPRGDIGSVNAHPTESERTGTAAAAAATSEVSTRTTTPKLMVH